MRVPTISVYKQATYQLNTITSEVSDANEEVTTGKRINTISDDPVGTGQVMALNSSLESVGQLLENVSHGQMILNQAETAMDSAADELLDLKQTCSQLATASASTQDRADAAETMDQIIETFLGLANTQVNGTYVFGGTQNNTAPFVLDNEDDPTQVIYQGNDAPVEIKTGENTTMALDCCGNDVFYEDEIIVDGTNNLVVVREDPGPEKGEPRVIEVEIPDGIYTREELATVVEDELRAASQEEGYGVGYQVDYDPEQNHFAIGEDGRGEDPISVGLVVEPTDTVRISNLESQGLETPVSDVEILDLSALDKTTPQPEGSDPLILTCTDDGTWKIENDPGYGLPPEIQAESNGDGGQIITLDMDQDGSPDLRMELDEIPQEGDTISFDIVPSYENNNLGPDLGFDDNTDLIQPAQGSPVSGQPVTVVEGSNDTIAFVENLSGGESVPLTATIPPGTYDDPQDYARAVEKAMEKESAQSGNRVNYTVDYDSETRTYSISEDGVSGKKLDSFDLLFGSKGEGSAKADLGFTTGDVHSGPTHGDRADWGIFDTLFDLEEALAGDDVDGIQRAMTRLDQHYNSMTTSISKVGTQSLGLTTTQSGLTQSKYELTTRRSSVEDADSVESIMRLQAAETTYQAALSSTSSILGVSLVDYM